MLPTKERPAALGSDRSEPGPGESHVLLCPISKAWVARKQATLTSAEHPGTAVRWGEAIFEVVEATAMPEGGIRYRLEPWDPRHAIRVVEAYDAAAEQARAAEQNVRRDAIRRRRLSILLSPILGHLPGPVQEKMEGDFGAPARAMTIVSAFPLFVLGTLGLLASRIALMGGGILFLPWLVEHPQVSGYLFAESAIRLWAALVLGSPMGSLPGVLAYELWQTWTRRGGPLPARSARPAAPKWETSDIYKLLEPLLALLSEPEQELLERRFGFDTLRWGRRSAILIGIIAALNLVISLGMLAQGRDTFWDFLWLLAGGYLGIEQLARGRRIAQGHPAGSILGGLVRPMARRLLSPLAAD